MRTQCSPDNDQARLAILENFRKINKMIRANFMLGDEARRGLDNAGAARQAQEDMARDDVIA